jgi:hypothetical protein
VRTPLAFLLGLIVALAAGGCAIAPEIPAGMTSCQPVGYTPAPIPFSFTSGAVDSKAAERTAVALFQACHADGGRVGDISSTTTADVGSPSGPNGGQAVWRVQVSGTVMDPSGATYTSHYMIEVNLSTGVPTLMAYG